MISHEALINYMNYLVIALIVSSALFGFKRGIFKSTYKFIVFIVLLLTGWFISPLIVNKMMYQDISAYNLSYGKIKVTNLYDTLRQILSSYSVIEKAVTEGKLTNEFINSITFMTLRISVLILWLILMATIFKFLFWIIYLLIKPRKYVNGKKRKKTIASRFGGMGVSIIHTLLFIMLLSVPFAGITSIGMSLKQINSIEDANSSNSIQLVYTSNGIKVANSTNEYLDEVVLFMENYRNTYLGKIGGVGFGGTTFDEYIFDQILSFKVNNTKIKLRSELKIAVKIYSKILRNLDGQELNLVNIAKLDTLVLEDIVNDISQLKIIHIAVPVGLEIIISSNQYKEKLGIISETIDLNNVLEKVVQVDFEKEIKSLGISTIKLIKILEEAGYFTKDNDGKFNIFGLDPEKVKELTILLSQSDLFEIVGDIALAVLLNTNQFEEFLNKYAITKEDLNLEGVKLNNELKNLGDIYAALINLGFKSTEISQFNFEMITDAKLNELATAVYASKLFSNNSKLLANILISSLPVEYQEIIFVNSFNQNDFVSVMSLMVILGKSGILNSKEFDPKNLLTEENIEKIAEYIANSDLLSDNVEGILELLLAKFLPIQIEFPENLTWKGKEGKHELIALFNTAKKIVNIMGNDGNYKFSKEAIDELSNTIVESRILMANIRHLITYILDTINLTQGYEVIIPEDIDFETEEGKNEFKALLHAVGVILDTNLINDPDLTKLSDGSVDPLDDQIKDLATALSDSRIIRENLTNLFKSINISDEQLDFDISSDDWTYSELNSLLRAVKVLMKYSDAFSLNVITKLSNEEIDYFVTSKILVKNAVNYLEDLTKEDGKLYKTIYLPSGDVEYYGIDGELKKFILAIQKIIEENAKDDEGLENLETISLDSITGENKEVVLASQIICETIIKNIEIIALDSEVITLPANYDRNNPNYIKGTWEEELPYFLDAIKVFVSDGSDITYLDFDARHFLSLTNEEIDIITKSDLIAYSIVSYITKENANENSLITLPNDLNPNDPSYNEALWYGDEGELKKMLRALSGLGLKKFTDDIDITVIFAEARGNVEEEVILASRVVEETIISKIIKEASADGSLSGILIIPDDLIWKVQYDVNGNVIDKGELRKLIVAIDILLDSPDLKFENVEFKVEKLYYSNTEPDRQDKILASRIVVESIINKIETEMALGGSLYGKLVKPDNFVKEDWYDKNGEKGELRRFIDAIEIILGDADFASAEFRVEKFFVEETQEVLLASKLVEASVINYIETEMAEGGSLHNKLVKPSDFVASDWYGVDGELRRFLKAIEVLLGENTEFENASFAVEKFFIEETQAILLSSRLIEASVVNTIEKEMLNEESILYGKLVKPNYFTEYDWYGENGELRRFIKAIKLLVGNDGNFTDAQFDVDTILGSTRDEILESKVVEASVIKAIKESNKLVIPDASNLTYYYFDDSYQELAWERTFASDGTITDIGELRRFLNGVSALLGGNSFQEFGFTMDEMLNVDFAIILESRILEATIAKTISELVMPGGILAEFILEPAEYGGYQWYYHANSDNPVRNGTYQGPLAYVQYTDLKGIIDAIQAMNNSGVHFNTITLTNIVMADTIAFANALWDYSRVIHGSIATILNKVLTDFGIPEAVLRFNTGSGNVIILDSKTDLINGLNQMKYFYELFTNFF